MPDEKDLNPSGTQAGANPWHKSWAYLFCIAAVIAIRCLTTSRDDARADKAATQDLIIRITKEAKEAAKADLQPERQLWQNQLQNAERRLDTAMRQLNDLKRHL